MRMKNRKHPNDSTVKISQNSKSPGNLRRLAVTRTPVKDHQLTWWEKLARSKIIIIIIGAFGIVTKGCEKKDKYLDLARELKKL